MARVLLVLLLIFLSGGHASAHAVLLETVPPDRAVIAASPDVIVLRFNENIQPITVELRDSAAGRISADIVTVDHEVHVVPRARLGAGAYFVSYRVTSADSHPVAGALLFAVGRAPEEWTVPTISAGTYTGWTWAAAINRALFLTAALIVAGGLIFTFAIDRGVHRASSLRPIIVRAAGGGIFTAIVGIYLHGGVLLDAAEASPWDPEIWAVGLESTRGGALIVAMVGLALCLARRKAVAILGVVLVVANFALSGHAVSASPRWIAIPTLLFHVGAVAVWLGSLVPLLNALRETQSAKAAIFQRFSDLALVIVPQLILAGVVLAILQIQKPDAFFASAYGLMLSLKLSLVGLLLVVAACNRWILLPEMADNVAGHAARFRRALQAEIVLGVGILCATAFLAQTVPPRSTFDAMNASTGAVREAGQTVLIVARDYKALLTVSPARPGRNSIRVRILGDDDRLIDPLEVTIDLSNTQAGIEPLRRKLTAIDDGYFEYSGPELALAGSWTVRIDALIDDFAKAIFETEILVK